MIQTLIESLIRARATEVFYSPIVDVVAWNAASRMLYPERTAQA